MLLTLSWKLGLLDASTVKLSSRKILFFDLRLYDRTKERKFQKKSCCRAVTGLDGDDKRLHDSR